MVAVVVVSALAVMVGAITTLAVILVELEVGTVEDEGDNSNNSPNVTQAKKVR